MSMKDRMLLNYRIHSKARGWFVSSVVMVALAIFSICVMPNTHNGEVMISFFIYVVVGAAISTFVAAIVCLHTGRRLFEVLIPLAEKFDQTVGKEVTGTLIVPVVSENKPNEAASQAIKVTASTVQDAATLHDATADHH